MKKVLITTSFTILILVISYITIYGQKGLIYLRSMQYQLAKLEQVNIKYKINNKKLREEIDLLKYNSKYIEDKARTELGLVKKEEIIYHMDKKVN